MTARKIVAIVVVSGAFLMSACSTTTRDFRDEAEKFLESKDLAKEAGYTYTDARCEVPTSTTIGSQFACRAVDNDGDEWTFIAEISGEREIVFVSGEVTG